MSRSLVALLENKLVEHAISATRPSGGSDGVSIAGWLTNGTYSSPIAALFIDGSAALVLSSPTGGAAGAELWGYRLSQWWRIGYINDGDDVGIVGTAQGFAQQLDIIGVFDRLCVAGTASTGTATAKIAPIDAWETP